MRKYRKITLILLILVGVFSIFLLGAWANGGNNGYVSFGVIGDVHNNHKKLDKIIKDYNTIDKSMNALILNGDIVDQGKKGQYENIEGVLTKNKDILPKMVIKNIGNHEYYDYIKGINTKEESEEFKKLQLKFSGEEKPYFQKWINGYNFIFIGSEESYTNEVDEVGAYISKDQKDWVKKAIEENYKKERPIFLFFHQNISTKKSPLVEEDKNESILDIIEGYPEIIMFYSHMHTSFKEKDIYKEGNITLVNTGAVDYTINTTDEKVENRDSKISCGLYVEALENEVRIKGRDFKGNTWLFEKGIPRIK